MGANPRKQWFIGIAIASLASTIYFLAAPLVISYDLKNTMFTRGAGATLPIGSRVVDIFARPAHRLARRLESHFDYYHRWAFKIAGIPSRPWDEVNAWR